MQNILNFEAEKVQLITPVTQERESTATISAGLLKLDSLLLEKTW